MKLIQIKALLVVASALLAAGCSTNKTGSNFNLARVNPFQWIKTESETKPYPQKPSSFASPTDLPGRYPETLASSAKGGTLPATPSAQAYPSAQVQYQSVEPSSYPSNPGATTSGSLGATPRSYPSTSPQSSGGFPSTNPVTPTAWQSSPAGTATVIDDLNSRQVVDSRSLTSGSTSYPVATGGAPAYNENLGPRESQGYAVGSRSLPPRNSYPATSQTQTATSPAQNTSSGGNTDWSTLVGDRYAQLYQKSNASVSNASTAPITGGDLGQTGYVPGATGYVPGQLDNPPGNINYQPGQTGYNPPGVPPYVMPYAPGTQQYSPSANSQPGSTVTNPINEYRPGSTKTYIPRTGNPATTQWNASGAASSSTGSLVPSSAPNTLSPSTNLSQTNNQNVPFRM